MTEKDFSAFVFKIQANMNKAHRDRIAFMRICSGKFEANMEVKHVQSKKKMRLSQPQQIMAQERKIVEEAYAEISSEYLTRESSLSETLSAFQKMTLNMKESQRSHQNILQESSS